MILQKLAQAIRRQDWFQVAVEVLIVIVGIFLGLQVQNWYEEQGERDKERLFLNRMHTEVIETLGYQDELSGTNVFLTKFKGNDQRLTEVLQFLRGDTDDSLLDQEHCQAIITSHIYFNTTAELPTVTEVVSSGHFSILQNEDIKTAISKYLRTTETVKFNIVHLEAAMLLLAREYPELIKVDLSRNYDEPAHRCDFHAMAQNKGFKNDIGDNAARFNGYIGIINNQQEKLENLHSILDAVLGINHEGEAL